MAGIIDFPTLILYIWMTLFSVAAVYCYSVNLDSKTWTIRVQGRALAVALWLLMVSVAVCRSPNVGTDTAGYIKRFLDYKLSYRIYWKDFIQLKEVEPLYYYATALIHTFTDNYHVYFLFVYSVIAGGFCWLLCSLYREFAHISGKTSIFAYLPIALAMTYYVHSLSVMRQWLSIGVALWAFYCLEKNESIRAFVLIVISGLIHLTGFSLIVVWIYYVWGHNRKFITKKVWLIACSVAIVILLVVSVALINRFMAGTRFRTYGERRSNLMSIIPNLVVIIGSIYLSDKIVKQGGFGKLCIICLPLQVAFLAFGQFGASRINYYFAFQNLYQISLIYRCIRSRIRWKYGIFALRVLIVLFVAVIYIRNMLMYANSSGVFPYEFVGFRIA